LESVMVGGRRFTSREAVERFVAAISVQSADGRKTADRADFDARADEALKSLGF
jgi:hypothetical protein